MRRSAAQAMSNRRMPAVQQLELKGLPPATPAGRGAIVLELGPRNWGIAAWMRDEREVPVYQIAHRDIGAVSRAARWPAGWLAMRDRARRVSPPWPRPAATAGIRW